MPSQPDDAAFQSIASLPIPYPVKKTLHDAHYRTVADLLQISPEDLSEELNISRPQAEDIILNVRKFMPSGSSASHIQLSQRVPSSIQPVAASTLLTVANDLPRYSTFSNSIDTLIGLAACGVTETREEGSQTNPGTGYVTPGLCLEISGPPGSGKTAFAMALTMSCRLVRSTEHDLDAREGPLSDDSEVLVIDTEGAMTAEHWGRLAEALARQSDARAPSDLLKGIHILRIPTQAQMIAFLNILDQWLQEHPKVTLVVIDTLSFHFRHPTMDMKTRSRVMETVKQQIAKATSILNCAVVVTNQLATKLLTAENKPANFDTGDRAVLMPQLGDMWTSGKLIRMVLFRGKGGGDEARYAHASSEAGKKDFPWARYDIDVR